MVNEAPSSQVPDQISSVSNDQTLKTVKVPWIVNEVRSSKKFIKMVLIVGLCLFGLYLMWKFFGWYFAIGFLLVPAWYFWALRLLDRESYMLIEVRLKGDEFFPDRVQFDTQTNVYMIPPDIWRTLDQKGFPYYAGNRIYICDHFDWDPVSREGTVYFADVPYLNNITFFTKAEMWLQLKQNLPVLQKDLAYLRYNLEVLVMERTTRLLEQFGVLEEFILHPKIHREVIKKTRQDADMSTGTNLKPMGGKT